MHTQTLLHYLNGDTALRIEENREKVGAWDKRGALCALKRGEARSVLSVLLHDHLILLCRAYGSTLGHPVKCLTNNEANRGATKRCHLHAGEESDRFQACKCNQEVVQLMPVLFSFVFVCCITVEDVQKNTVDIFLPIFLKEAANFHPVMFSHSHSANKWKDLGFLCL